VEQVQPEAQTPGTVSKTVVLRLRTGVLLWLGLYAIATPIMVAAIALIRCLPIEYGAHDNAALANVYIIMGVLNFCLSSPTIAVFDDRTMEYKSFRRTKLYNLEDVVKSQKRLGYATRFTFNDSNFIDVLPYTKKNKELFAILTEAIAKHGQPFGS
jgi:hypothetical protein